MKRDMNLIRQIALKIEDSPTASAPDDMTFDGYTPEQVAYHQYLMLEAGLARGFETPDISSTDGPTAQLTGLTWHGHEFAEAARDDTRWKKAMGIVQDKGGSVTMSVLTELLKQIMRSTLGLP